MIEPQQRAKLERLELTVQGLVHYRSKTPCCDGATHVLLEPLDLLARHRPCTRRPGALTRSCEAVPAAAVRSRIVDIDVGATGAASGRGHDADRAPRPETFG